jgi:ubiquinone/menaquinone biosynthesis C-methylase UbiE
MHSATKPIHNLAQDTNETHSDLVNALWKKESVLSTLRREKDQLEDLLLNKADELSNLSTLVDQKQKSIETITAELLNHQKEIARLNGALNDLRENQILLKAHNELRELELSSIASNEKSWESGLLQQMRSLQKIARLTLRWATQWQNGILADYRLIKESGIFDTQFYSYYYPDVAKSNLDPILHYLTHGANEGRIPSPLFHTRFYLEKYGEVTESGLNPLVHYIKLGWKKNFDPNPLFDSAFYKSQYNVSNNPLAHYLSEGLRNKSNPHPLFDSSFYLETNPDVARSSINPLAHFFLAGAFEGRKPHLLFDSVFYLERLGQSTIVRYPLEGDPRAFYYYVHRAQKGKGPGAVNPLLHFLQVGAKEAKDPNVLFNTRFYTTKYPDIVESGVNPLVDFLKQPGNAPRQPHPLFDPVFYLEKYPTASESGENPLSHFVLHGSTGAFDPNPSFDSSYYLELNGDVKRAGLNPLKHYILYGVNELRKTQLEKPSIQVNAKDSCPTQEIETKTNDQTELAPPETLDFVGGPFKAVGEEFKRIFIEKGSLKPHERVLDVGCGIGRMAVPLTTFLTPEAEYAGFDIVKEGIDWCQKEITTRFPNFRFQHLDIYNRNYNRNGSLIAETCAFPYESNYFDFVFLTSVFTHMLPVAMENYLSEITRVLKPEGRCLITYFLLNSESRDLMSAGSSTFQFGSAKVPYAYASEDNPEFAIAFDEDQIRRLYAKFSIELIEPIYFGCWCGRKNFLSYQDVVVGRKMTG